MAREKSRGKLIPSETNRERSIVIIVVIVAVAIILIVVGLAIYFSNRPGATGENVPVGPTYNTPGGQTPNQTTSALRLVSYNYTQNASSGQVDFFVTVRNNADTEASGQVTVTIHPLSGTPSPNQPYPQRENPTITPSPFNAEPVTLAPGETKEVQVTVGTPPGFTFVPGNVIVAVA